jgi:hypothetical protein
MKKLLVAAGLFILCISAQVSVSGQEANKERIVIVPPSYVLPTVVSQADCPVQIERAVVVKHLTGKVDTLYLVRNTGTKPIRTYTIARWYSDGTGVARRGVMPPEGEFLQPGQTAGSFEAHTEIVPLTASLSKSLKLDKQPMQSIVFFLIVDVEFSDGTRYDAGKMFDALEGHLKKLAPAYEVKSNWR